MKHLKVAIACCLFLSNYSYGQKQDISKTVTLEITNIQSFRTKLYVGIYESEKGFKTKSNAIDSVILIPKKESIKLPMKVQKGGYYAAAGFQDLNGNGKLDTGIFGIPIEPVCVSDFDHKPTRPPTFKRSEFHVINDTTIVMPLLSGKKEAEKLEKKH